MRAGMRALLLLIALCCALPALAASPQDFLDAWAAQARQTDPAFAGFSAERGRAFYFSKHEIDEGSELSCASCHHDDPRRATEAHLDQIPCRACHITFDKGSGGRSRVIRRVLPFAPAANPGRFANEWKVETWLAWNCSLLLKRECTPVEKGDLLSWLLTIKAD